MAGSEASPSEPGYLAGAVTAAERVAAALISIFKLTEANHDA